MPQEELNDFKLDDVVPLANLLISSQLISSLGREGLCITLGIDPNELDFLTFPSNEGFALKLINFLFQKRDRATLCNVLYRIENKLQKGDWKDDLETIRGRLKCAHSKYNPPSSGSEFPDNLPHQPYRTQPQSWFSSVSNAKNKLLAGGAILLIGLAGAGFQIYRQKTGPYAKLDNLLSAKQWKDADHETAQKMWEVAGRLQDRSLRVEDFEKIPCEDLQTMDVLWKQYSKEHYGFSVQSRIWQSSDVNANFDKFVARVKWGQLDKNGSSLAFYYLMDGVPFDLSQPKGHLPWAPTYYGGNSETRQKYMSKLVECFPNP